MNRKDHAARRLTAGVMAVVSVISVIAVFLIMGATPESAVVNRPVTVDKGWYVLSGDGIKEYVDIKDPLQAADGKLVVYNDAIASEYRGQTVSTKAAQYGLRVKQGDKTLFAYDDSGFKRNYQMKENLFCDIDIADQGASDNETSGNEAAAQASIGGDAGTGDVSFEYYNIKEGYITLPEIKAGSSRDIFWDHCRSEAVTMCVALIFIFMAVVCAGASISMRRLGMKDRRIADIALFMLICSVWEITNSPLTQQLSGVPDLAYYLSFCMFMLMGVPLCSFILNTKGMEKRGSIFVCMILFCLNLTVQNILYFTASVAFADMLPVTHILIAAGIITAAAAMAREARGSAGADDIEDRSEIKQILTAFVMLGGCGLLALAVYWGFARSYAYYNMIFWVGMALFMAFLMRCQVVSIIHNIQFRSETVTYQKLSETDFMTGLGNHAAFSREMEAIERSAEELADAVIIFINLSGMKKINDRYGYRKGDEIIIAVSNAIRRVFGEKGLCYRTYGDEFCVIIPDPGTEADEAVWSEQLRFEMSHITNNGQYEVELYWGCSFIRDSGGRMKSASDWKFEADKELSEHRRSKRGSN